MISVARWGGIIASVLGAVLLAVGKKKDPVN